jgi:hypothetical protein
MIRIDNVSPEQFSLLENKLATSHQAAVAFNGPATGTITGHGVTANFSYDQPAQSLTVNITNHPWYVSEGAVEGNLRKALGQ